MPTKMPLRLWCFVCSPTRVTTQNVGPRAPDLLNDVSRSLPGGQIQAEIQEVSRALRESTKNLCRNLKDNPNISGNLMKIQRERTELIDLLNNTCRQVAEVRSRS